MSYIEEYKTNFAKAFFDETPDCLDENECKHIKKLFKGIRPEYHPDVAKYPLWLGANQRTVLSARDIRRIKEVRAQDKPAYFLFSKARVIKYLDHLESQGLLACQQDPF